MSMHKNPHRGKFIAEVYVTLNRMSGRKLAAMLNVSASTLNRILKGTYGCLRADA